MSSPMAGGDRLVLVTATGRAPRRWSGEVMAADWAGGQPATMTAEVIAADDLLVLCPSDVELLDGAEAAIAEMLVHDPDIDLAYFDGLLATGAHTTVALRPGFSPERLRDQHYLGPVLVVRGRALLRHLAAGDRLDLRPDPGQITRLAARCDVVAHLPRLLYRSTLADPVPADGHGPVPADRPLVSVVIPTMGARRSIDGRSVTLCLQAIESLVERTDYRPMEIVPVLTPGTPDDLEASMGSILDRQSPERRPTLLVCRDERAFNFSNACNRGAVSAGGDVLVFLNDDTAVVSSDWLDRVVALALEPGVGAVGARLLYGDGSIQHAGIWSRGGHPAHRYEGFRADHPGHLDSLTVTQNCLAVTGACLAVEADKFRRAGGFCPEFPSSYNDVDLCLKLGALGHRTVVEPRAVLTHYEASTRDPVIEDWELELLHRRWRRTLIADPHDNPNHLAPGAEEFPPPAPTIAVERQRTGRYGHPARIWRRSKPMTDLIDLERQPIDRLVDEERHVV